MNTDAMNVSGTPLHRPVSKSEQLDSDRKTLKSQPEMHQDAPGKLPNEELIGQIKSLSDDGLYNLKFETDKKSNDLIVKIIDRDTQEVIRQMPPEEILDLKSRLHEYTGNLLNVKV